MTAEIYSAENLLQVSVDNPQSHSPSSSWQSAKTFGDMKETAKGSLNKPIKHLIRWLTGILNTINIKVVSRQTKNLTQLQNAQRW